jgi:ketosteroid isomerase-like protein
MSEENVGITLQLAASYIRGDIDEALSYLDPEIVYKRAEEAAVQGREEVRAAWERWEADWEESEVIPEEPIEAGDYVILPALFRVRGRGSGIALEDRFYEVFELREGRIVRWEEFSERAEALEAAGLRE